jgi:trypsin
VTLKRVFGIVLACGLLLGVSAGPVQGKKIQRVPEWGGLDSPLRPGASLVGGCTFNFVFYKPGTQARPPIAYIGTAAHCTDELDQPISQSELGAIGTVVYDSDLVDSPVDFSLIKIDPKFVASTNPQVLGWGGPTGVVTMDDLDVGDQIDIYGYGLGVGLSEQTRPRYGYLVAWNEHEYQADMPAVNGDSGSPLIHHETGAALGIVSRYGFVVPPTTDLGPLMPWILDELHKAGFDVRLATAE